MGAGLLTELLTVQRETRVRRAGGDFTSSWDTIGQTWAVIDKTSGAEKAEHGSLRATSKVTLRIYSAAAEDLGLTAADRIIWNGVAYQIRSVQPPTISSAFVMLDLETGVAT